MVPARRPSPPVRAAGVCPIEKADLLADYSSNQKEWPGRRAPKRFVLDVYTIGCCLGHAHPALSTTCVIRRKKPELSKTSRVPAGY